MSLPRPLEGHGGDSGTLRRGTSGPSSPRRCLPGHCALGNMMARLERPDLPGPALTRRGGHGAEGTLAVSTLCSGAQVRRCVAPGRVAPPRGPGLEDSQALCVVHTGLVLPAAADRPCASGSGSQLFSLVTAENCAQKANTQGSTEQESVIFPEKTFVRLQIKLQVVRTTHLS